MGKKQALTEFHRGAILAAAERLFAEKGTNRTTMDDIAREAEYSKATLYVYFQSKMEIINAILLSGMVLLQKKIHGALSSGKTWLETYDAVSETVIAFYRDNPTAFEAMTGCVEIETDEDQRVTEILRVCAEIDTELAAFLERGIAEGVLRQDLNSKETVLMFWSSLAGFVRTPNGRLSYIQEFSGLAPDEYVRQGIRFLLGAITAS